MCTSVLMFTRMYVYFLLYYNSIRRIYTYLRPHSLSSLNDLCRMIVLLTGLKRPDNVDDVLLTLLDVLDACLGCFGNVCGELWPEMNTLVLDDCLDSSSVKLRWDLKEALMSLLVDLNRLYDLTEPDFILSKLLALGFGDSVLLLSESVSGHCALSGWTPDTKSVLLLRNHMTSLPLDSLSSSVCRLFVFFVSIPPDCSNCVSVTVWNLQDLDSSLLRFPRRDKFTDTLSYSWEVTASWMPLATIGLPTP